MVLILYTIYAIVLKNVDCKINNKTNKIDSKRLTINNKQSTYWIVEKI